MLSEAEALALLKQHCSPLKEAEWVNASYHHRGSWLHDGWNDVDMGVGPPQQVERRSSRGANTGRDIGAKLRLALGVAQAVSCCRGFEPATHQDFWRRAVQKLWCEPHFNAMSTCVFSASTFTHVGILWTSRSRAEDSFWTGFFHGTLECNAALALVRKTLRRHLVDGLLPPLRVTLLHCCASEDQLGWGPDLPYRLMPYQCSVLPGALKSLLRAALTTPTGTSRTAATHVGLVVEYLMDQDPNLTVETLDLLERARTPERHHVKLAIERLAIHCQLAPPVNSRSESQRPSIDYRRALIRRGRELGHVLRMLLVHNGRSAPRVRGVEMLECSFSDYRLVGAVLSAVALASPPVEKLRCCGLFDAPLFEDRMLRLAWLAYTLHRRQGTPLALSLVASGTIMTHQEREYLEQLVANGLPLRDVVGESLRLRFGGDDDKVARLNVECLPLGSTVRLPRGTRLYLEPMRVEDVFVVGTLEPAGEIAGGEEVDLVAHLIVKGVGWVGVVYGGYGLVWAEDSCVVAWQRLDSDVAMADDETPCSDSSEEGRKRWLSSLSLTFNSSIVDSPFEQFPLVHRACTVLPLLACPTVETLTLVHAVVTRNDLAQMLESFPALRMLGLDRCAVESLAPLADAYQRYALTPRRTRIAALSLLGARHISMRDVVLEDARFMTGRMYLYYTPVARDFDREVAWLAPLLDVLADGTSGCALNELHIDLMGMREADQRAVLTRLASSTRSIVRLNVVCRWNGRRATACATTLAPLRDAVLRDPPRVRCAVLSVLRAFGCGVRAIAQMVLAWSEGSVVRTATWMDA